MKRIIYIKVLKIAIWVMLALSSSPVLINDFKIPIGNALLALGCLASLIFIEYTKKD